MAPSNDNLPINEGPRGPFVKGLRETFVTSVDSIIIFFVVVVLFNGLWQFTVALDSNVEEAFLVSCNYKILHRILRAEGRSSRELLYIGDLGGYLELYVSAAYRENLPRRGCALT